MRCRQCDYPLWGIRDRICPECGLAFAPSQFLFKRSAVAYRCPHCDQAYYGTTAQGHLHPRKFSCVSCAQEIDMDEMVLTPTEGVPEGRALADRKNPWEQRKGLGFFGAWLRTSWMALSAPRRLMSETSHRVLLGSAVWYAIFSLVTMSMVGFVLAALVGVMGAGGRMGGGFVLVTLIGAALFQLIPLAIGVGLIIVVWSFATHVLILFSGGGRHGWGWSALAISYGAGAAALITVPLIVGVAIEPRTGTIGIVLTVVAWSVSAALMLTVAQRVSNVRAFVATLTPPALSIALLVGAGFWMRNQMLGGVGAPMAFGGYAETQPVTSALRSALQRGDLRHPVEFIASGELGAADLLLTSSSTTANDVVVGGLTLSEYESLGAIDSIRQIQIAADELPEDVIAFRLGDFVFCHPGVDLGASTGPRSLWIAIAWPDPEVNVSPGASDMVWVGDSNGRVMPVAVSQFGQMLNAQNQLREPLGLAPIPHPSTVLHGQPAIAP